jgi:putative DNA primase/helicase
MIVKSDFMSDIKKLEGLTMEERLFEEICKDLGKINITRYLINKLSSPFNNYNEKIKLKQIRIGLIDYILETAANKIWKFAKDESNKVYIYNGMYWTYVNENDIKEFLKKLILKQLTISKHLQLEMKDKYFQEKLYEQFIHTIPTKTRKTNLLINLKNGTFNLETMELQEFNPDDFLTYQLPFEYDPNAVNPLWEKFINEVIPSKKTKKTVQEVLGSIFVRNLKLEYAFFFYGSGANGKSVIADVLDALLGENNVSHFSIGNLNGEYNLAELKDKLLNIATETDMKDIKSDLFKRLASGEPIIARYPYGRPFELKNYAKFIFYVNEIELKDIEYSEGFFRRFLIIPFKVTIPEEKRDKELAKKIINNGLSGIFNWIIEGAKRVILNKDIFISNECKTAFKDFLKEVDTVLQFLDSNNLVKSTNPQDRYYIQELYQNYKEWCINYGLKYLSQPKFSRRINKLGFDKSKDKRWYFLMKEKY